MIKTFEASGKSVEEAIDKALLLAGTTIENVDIEVLELGGRGVFGFGKKDARVRITQEIEEPQPEEKRPPRTRPAKAPKARMEERQPAAFSEDEAPVVKEMIRTRPATTEDTSKRSRTKEGADREAPIKEAPIKEAQHKDNGSAKSHRDRPKEKEQGVNRQRERDRTANGERAVHSERERGYRVSEGEEAAALSAEALRFLEPVFRSLKVNPRQETVVKEGILWLVFSGHSLGSLIGRRGETLNALQYLTNLAVNRDKKDHVRLVLDVEGYRAGREETLVSLAKKMAEKAVRSGRRVELEPMNPHERRIVHIALQNDKRVDTISQGEEPYRRVVITRRRSDGGHKRRPANKGENQAPAQEKMSLSQQLGQQFTRQMEQR